MLRFFRPKEQQLFVWFGVIQRSSIKQLYSHGEIEQNDLAHLSDFCFPTKEPISGPLSYVFRFKSSSGSFYNVFCLLDQTSFQLKEMDPNQQCCICIISPYFHFSAFEEILKIVRSLLLRSIPSAEHFLETLATNPRSITSIPALDHLLDQSSSVESYVNALANEVSQAIDSSALAHVILALLTDTAIIVVSSDLSKLSRFCYSILSLIYPLQWHLLFVPVVPFNMIDSVQSPVPFIVGLHRYLIPSVASSTIEGHLLIDVDEGTFESSTSYQLPSWAISPSQSLSSPEDFRSFILKTICLSLGIQCASSPSTTARRIIVAVRNQKFDQNSFTGLLLSSRTVGSFIESIKKTPISPEYASILSCGSSTRITSPAAQDVTEFPLRKQQVPRSMSSMVFNERGKTRSISMPVLSGETASEGQPPVSRLDDNSAGR